MNSGEVAERLFDIDSSVTTLAHELKSPLVLIRQLALTLDESSDNDVKIVANKLNLTADRALRLVSDLSKVSRLENAMFEMSPINPKQICDKVLYNLKDLYELNKRKLDVNYTNRSNLVIANHDLLESVIYNLCDNAMHYSGENTPSELFVKSVNKQKIRIGVRDFGPSLPLDIWRSIKKTGLSQPTPIQARPQSSGLGLYISSRFIKAMNGDFGVIRHRDGTSLFIDLHISNQLSLL